MADLSYLADDWPAVSRLLDHALDLPAAQRGDWLNALPETTTVKAALGRLLASAAAVETADFLEALPPLTLAPDQAERNAAEGSAHAGLVVGPYRLSSELGVGGMGSVWLAERIDGGLKRQVAVKLPRATWARGLAERMARERDILSSLDHPNIARIHDAGLDERGRPYLALEYVVGEPIDTYCRRLALPTAGRLALVLQVARAVAHAHARLVVHRDLKPANILVTAEGQVRLLDFGIAKLMMQGELASETELTAASGRALTLAYASPEQIRGEPIGTASDVYSLGVVAYELLADAKPYDLKPKRQGAAALEEAVANADVRLASAASASAATRRALKGDLDAILNKALKKNVADRYQTVDAFARDIERHLAREPVSARPDAPAYLLRRFVVRHVLLVSAGAAVALALIVGSALALWQARVAQLEAARAEQVKTFALSIVNGADTEAGAGRETTAVELLRAAKVRLQNEPSTTPETAVELMTAVGTGLQSQGQSTEAAELLRVARDRGTQALGAGHRLTLAAATAYGTALLGTDHPKDAIAALSATAQQAERSGDTLARSAALRELSSAQLAAADGAAGLASARAAVAALESIKGPTRPLDAFYAWAQLANALNVAHDPALVDAARHALDLARQVYGDRLTDNVLSARLLLAKGLLDRGSDREGLAELEGVYRDAVRLLGPEHPRIEAVANFLGSARSDAGDSQGAVAVLRIALSVGEHNPNGTGGNRGIGHYVLGRALALQHSDREALEHFDASAALLAAAVGADSVFTRRSRSAGALVMARLGRVEEADRAFAALADTKWPPAERAQHESRVAELRSLQGRHDEALTLARSATEALKASLAKGVRAQAEATLGNVLLAAGRREEAIAPLREAVRLWSEKQLAPSPDRVAAEAALARALATAPNARAS